MLFGTFEMSIKHSTNKFIMNQHTIDFKHELHKHLTRLSLLLVSKSHDSCTRPKYNDAVLRRGSYPWKNFWFGCHGSPRMKSIRVIQREIDNWSTAWILHNHKPYRSIMMMNDDDDTPAEFMIQSSQQVSSSEDFPNVSESSMACRGLWERASPARTLDGWAVAKPETAAHRSKLVSDKFGNDQGDQTECLIES